MPAITGPLTHVLQRQASETLSKDAVDTSTNAPAILANSGVITGIAVIIVLARIYVRCFMLKTFGYDDYFIAAATLCSLGVFICFVGETRHGLGMFSEAISSSESVNYTHWNFFHSIIVTTGISLVKISLGFFLLRLVTKKSYKMFVTGMLVFLTVFMFVSAFTIIFACLPVQANWDTSITDAKCYSISTFTAIGLTNSCINIVTDVVFACLPLPIIWNLQITTRTRVTLMAILSLGFFACAAGIVKTYLQTKVFTTPEYLRHDSYAIWNSVELAAGIIAASLPALRPLFAAVLEKTKSSFTTRHGNGTTRGDVTGKHKYYAQDDSFTNVEMDNLGNKTQTKNGYNVNVTAKNSVKGRRERADSKVNEEDLERIESRDSVDLFIMKEGRGIIMREGTGIMKSVAVTVHNGEPF